MSENREKCKVMLGELVKLIRVDTKMSEVTTATTQELHGLLKLYRSYLDTMGPVMETFPLELTQENVEKVLDLAQQQRAALDTLLSVRATSTYQECSRRMDSLQKVFSSAKTFLTQNGTVAHLESIFNKKKNAEDDENNNNDEDTADASSAEQKSSRSTRGGPSFSSTRTGRAGASSKAAASFLMPATLPDAVVDGTEPLTLDLYSTLYNSSPELANAANEQARRSTIANETLDKCASVLKGKPPVLSRNDDGVIPEDFKEVYQHIVDAIKTLDATLTEDTSGFVRAQRPDAVTTREQSVAIIELFDQWKVAISLASRLAQFGIKDSTSDAGEAFEKLEQLSASASGAGSIESFVNDSSTLSNIESAISVMKKVEKEVHNRIAVARSSADCLRSLDDTAVLKFTHECKASDPTSFVPYLPSLLGWKNWTVETNTITAIIANTGEVVPLLAPVPVPSAESEQTSEASTWLDSVSAELLRTMKDHAATLCSHSQQVARGSAPFDAALWKDAESNVGTASLLVLFTSIVEASVTVSCMQKDTIENDVDSSTTLEIISQRPSSARRDSSKKQQASRLVQDRMSAIAGPFSAVTSPRRPTMNQTGQSSASVRMGATRGRSTTNSNNKDASRSKSSPSRSKRGETSAADIAAEQEAALLAQEEREAAALADAGGHPGASLAALSSRAHRRACSISMSHKPSASSRISRNMSTTLQKPGSVLRTIVEALKEQLRKFLAVNDFASVRKYQEWLSWARLFRQLWNQEIRNLTSVEEFRWLKLLRAHYERDSQTGDVDIVFSFGTSWTDRFRWNLPQSFTASSLDTLPSLATPTVLELFEKLIVIGMSERAVLLSGYSGSGRHTAIAQIASLLGVRVAQADISSFARDAASSLRRSRALLQQGTFLITPCVLPTSSSSEITTYVEMLRSLLQTDGLLFSDPRIISFVDDNNNNNNSKSSSVSVPPVFFKERLFHPCVMPSQLVHNTVETLLECCAFESCVRDASTRVRALISATEPLLKSSSSSSDSKTSVNFESFFGVEGLCRFATRARDNLWAGHCSTELHAVAQAVEDVWISRASGHLLTSILVKTHSSLFLNSSATSSGSSFALPVTGDKNLDAEIRRLSDPEKSAFVSICRLCDPTRRSYPLHRVRPVLVWGAAGSGKTNAIRVAHAALFDSRNITASIAHVTTTVDGDSSWKRIVNRQNEEESSGSHLWLVFHGVLSKQAIEFALNISSSVKNENNSKITVFIEADQLNEAAVDVTNFSLKCDTVRCEPVSLEAAVRAVLQSEPFNNLNPRAVSPELLQAFEAWVEQDLEVSVAVLSSARQAILSPSDISVWTRVLLQGLAQISSTITAGSEDKAVCSIAVWTLGALFLRDPRNSAWDNFVRERFEDLLPLAPISSAADNDEQAQQEDPSMCDVCPTKPDGHLAVWSSDEHTADDFFVPVVAEVQAASTKNLLLPSSLVYTRAAVGTLLLASHKSLRLKGPSGTAKTALAELIAKCVSSSISSENGNSNSVSGSCFFIKQGTSLSDSLMEATSQSATAVVVASQKRSSVDNAVLRHLASPTANACASIGLPPVGRVILLETTPAPSNNSRHQQQQHAVQEGIPTLATIHYRQVKSPEVSLMLSGLAEDAEKTAATNQVASTLQGSSSACAVSVQRAMKTLSILNSLPASDEKNMKILSFLLQRVLPHYQDNALSPFTATSNNEEQEEEEASSSASPTAVFVLPSMSTGSLSITNDIESAASEITSSLTEKYSNSEIHIRAVEEASFALAGSALTVIVTPPGRGAVEVASSAATLLRNSLTIAPSGLQFSEWPEEVQASEWLFVENGSVLTQESWAAIRRRKFELRTIVCLRAAELYNCSSSIIPLWVREDALFVKSLSPKLSTFDTENENGQNADGEENDEELEEKEQQQQQTAASSSRRKSFARSSRGGASSNNNRQQPDPKAAESSALTQALFEKVSAMSDEERNNYISSLYMHVSPECTVNETSAAINHFNTVTESVRHTQAEQIQSLVSLSRFAADVDKAVQNGRQKTVPQNIQAVTQYEMKIEPPKTKIFEGTIKFNEYPDAPVRLFLRFDENRNKLFNNVKEAAVFLSTPAHEGVYVPSASGGTTRVRMDGDSAVVQTGFLDLRLTLSPTLQHLQNNSITSDSESLVFTLSGTVTDPTQSHAKVGLAELKQVDDQSVASKNWLRWGNNDNGEEYQEESRPMLDTGLLSGSAEESDKILTAAQNLMKKTCSQVDAALREAVRAEKTALPNALSSSLILAFASLSLTEREKRAAALVAANPGLPDPLSPPVIAYLLGESTAESLEWLSDQRTNCALPPGAHNDFIALLVRGLATGKIGQDSRGDCHSRLMIVDSSGSLTIWLKNYCAALESEGAASVRLPSSNNKSSSSSDDCASMLSTLPEAAFACAFGAKSSTMGAVLKYAESRHATSPFIVVREDDVEEIGHCSWGNNVKGIIFDARQSTSSLAATLQSSPVDASVGGPAASQAAARSTAIIKAANAMRTLQTSSKDLKSWLQGKKDHYGDAYASIVAEVAHPEEGLAPVIQQLEQGRSAKNETLAFVEPTPLQMKKDAQMNDETAAVAKRAAALAAAIPRALTSALRFGRAYALPDIVLRQACEKCFSAARREPKGFDLVSRGLIETVMHGILPQDRLPFLVALAEEVMVEENAAGAHEWVVMTGHWSDCGIKSLVPLIDEAEEEQRRQQQAAAEAAAQRRQEQRGGRSHQNNPRRGSSAPGGSRTRAGATGAGLPPKAPPTASVLRARPQMLYQSASDDYYITQQEWAGFLVAAETVATFFANDNVSSEQNLLLEAVHDPALLSKGSSKVSKWKDWFDKPSLAVPGFEKISAHARFALAWGFWSVAQPGACAKIAELFVAEVFGSWITKDNEALPPSNGADLEHCTTYSVESIKAALVSQTGTTLPLLMVRDKNCTAADATNNIEKAFEQYQTWLAAQSGNNNNNSSSSAAASSTRGKGTTKAAREREAAAQKLQQQQQAAEAAAAEENSKAIRNEVVTLSIHDISSLVSMLKEGAQTNVHKIIIVRDAEEATSEELGEILNFSIIPVTDSGSQAVPTSSLRLVLLVEAQNNTNIVAATGTTSDDQQSQQQQHTDDDALRTLTQTTMPRCHISGPTSRFHIKKQLEAFCADERVQSAIAMAPNDTWRRLIFLCGAVCAFLKAREAGVMSSQVLINKINNNNGDQQIASADVPSSEEGNSSSSSSSSTCLFSSSAAFDYDAVVTLLLRTSVSTMLAVAAAKSNNSQVHFHRWNHKALSATAQVAEIPWDATRRSLAVLLSAASPRAQTEVVEAYVDWLFHPATLTPDIGSGNPMLDIGGIVQVPMVSPCAPTTFANAVRELNLPEVDADNIVELSHISQALLGTRAVALAANKTGTAASTDSLVSKIEEAAHKNINEFFDRVMEEAGESFVAAPNSSAEVVATLARRLRESSPCMLHHMISAVLSTSAALSAQLGIVERVLDVNNRKLEDLIAAAANRTPGSSFSAPLDNTCSFVTAARNGLADLSHQVKMMTTTGGLNNNNTDSMSQQQQDTMNTSSLSFTSPAHFSASATSSFLKFSSSSISGNIASLCCSAFADHISRKGPEAALDETAIFMVSPQLLLPSNNFALQQEEQMMNGQTGTRTVAMLGQAHLAGAILAKAESGSPSRRRANRGGFNSSNSNNNNKSAATGLSKLLLRRASLDAPVASASDTDGGGVGTGGDVGNTSVNNLNTSVSQNQNQNQNQQQQKNEVALRIVIRKAVDLQIQAQNDLIEEQLLQEEENGKKKNNNNNDEDETKDVAPFWGAKLSPIGLSRRYLLCQQLHRPPVALHAGPATILQGTLRASALRNALPLSQQQQQSNNQTSLDGTLSSTTGGGTGTGTGQVKFSQSIMTNASTAQIQLFCGNSNNNSSNLFVEVPSSEAPQVWTLSGTHLRV